MIKKTPTERFVKQGLHYTTTCNEVLNQIKSPTASAIYTYLLSKSEDWVPRREDIKKRWSLGDYSYRAAMKELRELGLVWDVVVKNPETKKIESKALVVGNLPRDIQDKLEEISLGVDLPQQGKNLGVDLPQRGSATTGETNAHTKESIITKESINTKTSNDDDFEKGFALFWNAGLPKKGTKSCKAKFKKLAKGKYVEFGQMLANDIQKRLGTVGYKPGFCKTPEPYLNGELWNDDLPEDLSSNDSLGLSI